MGCACEKQGAIRPMAHCTKFTAASISQEIDAELRAVENPLT